MYGKIFETLYEGSMVGSGAKVFAVWGYVIAKMRKDEQVGAQVDLNPKILAFIFGEKESEIEKVIDTLCSPDAESRSPDEKGRRLVRLGQFTYRVVNGKKYMDIRDAEERREYFRSRKAIQRASKVEQDNNAKDNKRPVHRQIRSDWVPEVEV